MVISLFRCRSLSVQPGLGDECNGDIQMLLGIKRRAQYLGQPGTGLQSVIPLCGATAATQFRADPGKIGIAAELTVFAEGGIIDLGLAQHDRWVVCGVDMAEGLAVLIGIGRDGGDFLAHHQSAGGHGATEGKFFLGAGFELHGGDDAGTAQQQVDLCIGQGDVLLLRG